MKDLTLTIDDVPRLVQEYKADPNCRPLLWIECETDNKEIIDSFLLQLNE